MNQINFNSTFTKTYANTLKNNFYIIRPWLIPGKQFNPNSKNIFI